MPGPGGPAAPSLTLGTRVAATRQQFQDAAMAAVGGAAPSKRMLKTMQPAAEGAVAGKPAVPQTPGGTLKPSKKVGLAWAELHALHALMYVYTRLHVACTGLRSWLCDVVELSTIHMNSHSS